MADLFSQFSPAIPDEDKDKVAARRSQIRIMEAGMSPDEQTAMDRYKRQNLNTLKEMWKKRPRKKLADETEGAPHRHLQGPG